MTIFPVTVGRKQQVPPPNIIFGGVSVRREHAQFIMLDNGLIQIEVNKEDQKAIEGTLINGSPLKDGTTQILHHLDTIYFVPGQMLLFKYPLQMKKYEELEEAYKEQNDAQEMAPEELFEKVFEQLKETGVTDDIENVICEDYSEEEISRDHDKVDWEQALMAIEAAQEIKRKEEFEKIAEQER